MVKKCAEEETGSDKVFGKCCQKIEVYIKKGCRGFSPNRFYPKDPAIIRKYRLFKKIRGSGGKNWQSARYSSATVGLSIHGRRRK